MVENQADREMLHHSVHELRNIFCIVIGNLELLRQDADSASTKLINRAMCGAQRVDAVIASLDALSKPVDR